MRLLKLEVINFRCFEHRTFNLSDRMLFVGPTGAGKSSVMHAIAWALTGRCLGVDARGSGQHHLIRDGATEARVYLTVEGFPIPIERSIAVGKSAECNIKPDAIAQRLEVNLAELTCLLYGRLFFDLGHAEAKDMIFRILDVKVSPAELPGLDLKQPVALDALDMLYTDAFNRRTGAKKLLAAHTVPEPPKVANISDGPIGDLVTLEAEAKATKAKARTARDAMVQAQTKRDQSRQELQRAMASGQNLASLRASLEAQIKMHADLLEQQSKLGPAELIAHIDTSDRSRYERLIESLEHHDPRRGCVLDASISCLTRGQEFTSRIESIKQAIGTMAAEEQKARKEGEAIRQRNAKRTENDRQIAMHETQIAGFKERIADAERLQSNIDRLTSDQPILDAAEISARRESADADEAESKAAERLQSAQRYYAATKGRDQALERKRELEAEVAKLETLVELLGPKGVRIAVLERTVKQFEEMINQSLGLFGFKLFIQAEPWQVKIGRVTDPWLAEQDDPQVDAETIKPWIGYSEGEKTVVAFAFQQALALLTNVDFLCVDAGEQVTGDFRGTLTGSVMSSPAKQILVAMGKAPNEPVPGYGAPEIDGLQVVKFEPEHQHA